MPLFEVAALSVGVIGVAGVVWVLLPLFRPSEEREEEPEAPSEAPDVGEWLDSLGVSALHEDDPRPWTDRRPMLSGPRRVPDTLVPYEGLPITGGYLLPLGSALLSVEHDAPVLRGRRGGRAFHLVRLEPGVYLDLIEAVRVVPVIGIEADAKNLRLGHVNLFGDVPSAEAAHGDVLGAIAPWLMGMEEARILPEGDEVREWTLRFSAGTLRVKAWVPTVGEGIARDRLGWAGVAFWDGEQSVVDAGATDETLLQRLVEDAAAVRSESLEAWRWSVEELTEAASVGFHLDGEGVDITAFLADVFADRCVPVPLEGEAQGLVAAATLNWCGVMARRVGRLQASLAIFEAAFSVLAEDDDDTRADLHYNRGFARLLIEVGGVIETDGLSQMQVERVPEPAVMRSIQSDFAEATRLKPSDADGWSQRAMLHQLLGERAEAAECWLQAATYARNPADQERLVANAEALR